MAVAAARALAQAARSKRLDHSPLGHVMPLDSEWPVAADRRYTSPTWVYRYFTEDGALAYVGMTCCPIRRDHEHARGWGGWRKEVAFMSAVLFPEREMAASVEEAAIRAERPYGHGHGLYPIPYHGRAAEWFTPAPPVWLALSRPPGPWAPPRVMAHPPLPLPLTPAQEAHPHAV